MVVHRDTFIKELNEDFNKSIFLGVGSFIAIAGLATLLWLILKRSIATISSYRGKTVETGSHTITDDPALDNFPVKPYVPNEDDSIANSVAFFAAMHKQATDKKMLGKKATAKELCKDRSCQGDDGMGGGTATAFDKSHDNV
jgi:hypothetical protein